MRYLLSLLLLSLIALPAQAARVNSEVATDRCMDVAGGSQSAGAKLVTWTCHTGKNQGFEFRPNGEIRVYGNMCLDAAGGQGRDGDAIVIWPCHGGANQRWQRTATGEIRGINGKCIDVAAGNTNPGANLVLWSCHGGKNQRWQVVGLPTNGRRAEQCFGGVGNGCNGGGPVPGAEVLANGNKRQWVNVGSIMHDNCCMRNPGGQHCSGFNPRQEGWPDNAACVVEWRKAAYNWRDGRSWKQDFGPYYSGASSDELTDAPARRGVVFNGTGQQIGTYGGLETIGTRRLAAPPGTYLDLGDEQFCESGRFRATGKSGMAGAYGICQ